MPVIRAIEMPPLAWGESVRWDDRRQRLYFVDCLTQTLYWLDGGELPLHALDMPGLPTGLVLTEGDEVVVCLDEGLHVVDPDDGRTRLLSRYPSGMLGRANDAHADGSGNLVTGTLNVQPGPGSVWRFGSGEQWELVADGIGNTNGPQVVGSAEPVLVVSDTLAGNAYQFPYDARGSAGPRRQFGDFAALGGSPDGATVDATDAIWTCVVGGGRLARFDGPGGPSAVIDLPVAYPSDVAFGGAELDLLFIASIAVELAPGVDPGADAGRVLVLEGAGAIGRPEPRFCLNP